MFHFPFCVCVCVIIYAKEQNTRKTFAHTLRNSANSHRNTNKTLLRYYSNKMFSSKCLHKIGEEKKQKQQQQQQRKQLEKQAYILANQNSNIASMVLYVALNPFLLIAL